MTAEELCGLILEKFPPHATVVLRQADDLAYVSVKNGRMVVACPDDTRVLFFETEDQRASGRVAETVLLLEP